MLKSIPTARRPDDPDHPDVANAVKTQVRIALRVYVPVERRDARAIHRPIALCVDAPVAIVRKELRIGRGLVMGHLRGVVRQASRLSGRRPGANSTGETPVVPVPDPLRGLGEAWKSSESAFSEKCRSCGPLRMHAGKRGT
jgi:hypothetical protein